MSDVNLEVVDNDTPNTGVVSDEDVVTVDTSIPLIDILLGEDDE